MGNATFWQGGCGRQLWSSPDAALRQPSGSPHAPFPGTAHLDELQAVPETGRSLNNKKSELVAEWRGGQRWSRSAQDPFGDKLGHPEVTAGELVAEGVPRVLELVAEGVLSRP